MCMRGKDLQLGFRTDPKQAATQHSNNRFKHIHYYKKNPDTL